MSTPAASRGSHRERAPRRRRFDRVGGQLATTGATLGVLAGLLALAIGPSIREWVGNKQDTTRLGLATIVLSAVALASALALRRPGSRIAIALGLVVPALICFTTVGRLWLVPGPLLLAGGGLVLAGSEREELAHAVDERHWTAGLVALCGAYYVFLGATALGVAGALGMLGGLLIWTAIALASRSHAVAHAVLAIGALPFALLTWWSVITPLIAILALAVGHAAVRQTPLARHNAT